MSAADRLVNLAFELPEQLQHLHVGEGQQLGQDHTGDAPLWVDPEVGSERNYEW